MLLPLAIAVAMATPPAGADITARLPPQPDAAVVAQVLDSAAAQVKRCYRSPKLGRAARQITTRLVVRFGPDGVLLAVPEVVAQSGINPGNQAFAGQMAEAAVLAVIRCSPIRLPADHYEAIWKQFELTFSPSAAA